MQSTQLCSTYLQTRLQNTNAAKEAKVHDTAQRRQRSDGGERGRHGAAPPSPEPTQISMTFCIEKVQTVQQCLALFCRGAVENFTAAVTHIHAPTRLPKF